MTEARVGMIAAATATVLFSGSGCATIIHGTSQSVPVTSEPSGAEIRINGAVMGTTPTTLILERKPDYDLEMAKPGYQTETVHLESVSQYDASSVLLGGLVGWGIDSSTGGNKRLYPESIHVVLTPTITGSVEAGGDAPESGIAQDTRKASGTTLDAQLNEIAALRTSKRITDEEYEILRRRLLETYSFQPPRDQGVPAILGTRARATSWLLGKWKGEHVGSEIAADDATLEFVENGGELRWTMTRRTTVRGFTGRLSASGVVVNITESTAELDGRYDGISQGRTGGKRLSYWLHRDGNTLEGFVVGSDNEKFRVSVRRVP